MRLKVTPWAFLTPFSLLFIIFLVGPLLYAFYISLFIRRMGVLQFVGFRNYAIAFQDHSFWVSILRVLYYGILQGVIMIVLALVLALLLETRYAKGKALFRLVYFLPYAVPGVFAAILWGFLYSNTLDPLLHVLRFNPLSAGALLYGIINIATWEWTGYNMTIYVAGLSGISQELYEAANLDGCNEWKLAYYIKLPLLKPMIVMTIILSMIGSVQLFNEPFLLTALTPISQDYTPNISIYNMAFSLSNLPYAATLSVLLGGFTILASVVVLWLTNMGARGFAWRKNRKDTRVGVNANDWNAYHES